MKTLFLVALLFYFAAPVSAQDKIIDKPEFDAAVVHASYHQKIWKGAKYRMTVTTSSKVADRPETDWSSKMVFEYGAANARRTLTTSAFGGKPIPAKESIVLGKWSYSRTGDGAWIRKEYESLAGKTEKDETPNETLPTDVEYKDLGPGDLMGKPVHIYAKTERRTRRDEESGEKRESFSKVTYWVGTDGALLRREYSSESRGTSATTHTVIITDWERDPTIDVTAPEIAP
jgi:hypothetical protein